MAALPFRTAPVRRLLPCLALAAASTQAADHPCAAVAAPDARLACYDRAFPPHDGATRGGATHDAAGRSDFGFTAAEVRTRAAHSATSDEPRAVAMTVVAVREEATGRFVATMDNGQVWAQTEADSRVRPRAGHAVTIKRGVLGSYLLVTDKGVGTRVRRIE